MANEASHETFYGRSGNLNRFYLDEVRLHIRLHDCFGKVTPNIDYEIEYDSQRRRGRADADGLMKERISGASDRCMIKWDLVESESGGTSRFNYQIELFVNLLDFELQEGIRRRLHNLGYPITRSFERNLREFQAHYGLEMTGEYDEPTKNKLSKIYEDNKDEFEEVEETAPAEDSGDEERT